MQKREKLILLITAIVVGVLLTYHFVLADMIESGVSLGSSELSQVRGEGEQYYETLRDRIKIETEYKQLALASEAAKGSSPGDIFNKDLYNMLTEKFKLPPPRMDPPRREAIPDVDDYYFITIKVNELSGPPRQMLTLLRELQSMGLIITNFKLERTSPRDAARVNLDFEVARLVKHTEQSRRQMNYLRKKNG